MSEIVITRRLVGSDRSTVVPAMAATFAAAMIVLAVVSVLLRLSTPWDGNRWAQWEAGLFAAGEGFAAVPVAGHSVLLPGDVVVAINGVALTELRGGPFELREHEPGGALQYEVIRSGQLRLVEQELAPFRPELLAQEWPGLLTLIVWLAIASYVFRKRPRDPAAQVMLVMGAAFAPGMFWLWIGISDLSAGAVLPLLTLYQPFYLLGIVSIVGLVAVFPHPWPAVVRRPRLIGAVIAAPIAACLVVLAHAHLAAEPVLAWGHRLAAIESTLYLGGGLVLAAGVPLRYRELCDPADRRRLLAVMGTFALVTFAIIAFWLLPSLAWGAPLLPWSAAGLVGIVIPVALGVAILRYGAFDLQLLINRSLVYGGATATVALIYVILVGGAILIVHERFGFAIALLATGLVIVIAQPVRDGLQRTINRLMYGDRDDPYQGIARLSSRLESSLARGDLLPVVVDTIASSLRLPYVAVELQDDEGARIAVTSGSPVERPLIVPLVHQSEQVGRLLVAPRVGEERLSGTDERLLGALATQVSAAIKTMQLDDQLRRSRERLVAAREEERRALRRELHDGIGPTLAGNLLHLQAARRALRREPERADELLRQLEQETRAAIAEVRRVARQLRPPALDALGLVGALREKVDHFSAAPELEVQLVAPPRLPPLTAAHEVAVYRIVLEALANVVRHAAARRCTIRLETGAQLVVTISDDGRGIDGQAPSGIGLRSMRERASELGGELEIVSGSAGGTVVRATFPLVQRAPA